MDAQFNISKTFSDEKIEKSYDLIIEKCIEKLGAMLKEYPNENHKQQFLELKKRYNNPELKLAVIGEFNTGKSTFINALLQKDYLSTENVPTTVIPTYIRWDGKQGSLPIIKIKLVGDEHEYVISESQELLEKKLGIKLKGPDDLEGIITNNDLIGAVSRVTVSFPADKRFANFCLIDTPGTNPGAEETKEHANITRSVLREEADTTIILFPANTTGNRSALEFISENASHLLGGAAFVITKADMIDSERDMEKITKYLKGLVKQKYGLEDQTIYTCSAKRALRANNAAEHSDPFLLHFNQMTEDMLKDLSRKRKQIIFKKVSALLNTVLSNLRSEQQELSQKLADDIEALEKYSLENLEEEYKQLFSEFENDLNEIYIIQKLNVNANVSVEKNTTAADIEADLNLIGGIGDLRSYASDGIKKRLDTFEALIKRDIMVDINELDSVYSDFSKKVFSRLKEYQLGISSQLAEREASNSIEVSSNVSMDVSIDGIIGGLGIGALILLFINPVTLVAVLAVGWLFSSALLRKMKNSIMEKVDTGLRQASGAVEGKWKNALDETKSKYLSSGKNLMNNYKNKYAEIFRERTAADEQKRQEMQRELSRINECLREIDIMESVLAIPARLNSYKDVDKQLIAKAIKGNVPMANQIAEKYQRLYNNTKSEEYHNCYLQWSAYSLLFV